MGKATATRLQHCLSHSLWSFPLCVFGWLFCAIWTRSLQWSVELCDCFLFLMVVQHPRKTWGKCPDPCPAHGGTPLLQHENLAMNSTNQQASGVLCNFWLVALVRSSEPLLRPARHPDYNDHAASGFVTVVLKGRNRIASLLHLTLMPFCNETWGRHPSQRLVHPAK